MWGDTNCYSATVAAMRWMSAVAENAELTYRASSMLLPFAAVRNGLGICCLPRYLCDGEAELIRAFNVPDEHLRIFAFFATRSIATTLACGPSATSWRPSSERYCEAALPCCPRAPHAMPGPDARGRSENAPLPSSGTGAGGGVAPDAVEGMYAANAYFDSCSIPRILRRLAELRVSQMNGCTYCIWLHSRQAYARARRRRTPHRGHRRLAVGELL
jgi:AhpD family alkylhydroperoxidase